MLLSDKDIIQLIKEGRLIITPLQENAVQCASVELHLSNSLIKYNKTLDLQDDSSVGYNRIAIGDSGYQLDPGEFVLGSTVEKVTIPNGYQGFIETHGNIARAGIQAHNADGHVAPGFSGNITLEIKNNSNQSIVIYPNLTFVQLYIFQMSSEPTKPYSGKYQNQEGATPYKKDQV